jgi:two-component system, OmpR family, sensor kinase
VAYSAVVTTGRLTRQELGWLLAQEARGAAKILRQDVTLLSQPPPPPSEPGITFSVPDLRVTTTLNALDDAIGMLSELEGGPAGPKPSARRGRIDLAALLWDFAPTASISIEPGAGTEVFGEEVELRRMLHVLLSQTNFAGGGQDAASAPVRIRREADWIRITVDLGPDVSASTDLERRWLSRMATRMGGQLELEGGTMSLVLPADASNDQSEVADLRKELVQAQQLGEAYARELATVFAAGQMPEAEVTAADTTDVAVRRFELLVAFASAVHRSLLTVFHALEQDAERLDAGPASSAIATHISGGYAVLGEIGRVAGCPRTEPTERVDVARAASDAVSDSETRAARHDVRLVLNAPSDLWLATRPRAIALLLRALIEHAIAATPKGGTVEMTLAPDSGGVKLTVCDGGPVVPASAQADLLEHRVDPAALGRPPGLALLVAYTVSGYLGGALRLGQSDSGGAIAEARLRPP